MQFTGSATFQKPALVMLLTALALPRPMLADESFYLLYRHWQSYDWPDNTAPAEPVSREQRAAGWRRGFTSGDIGVDYDYQPLRIRTGDPAHNGHLHRVTFGGQWRRHLYHFEARAGLAGTSNMFKDQNLHGDVVNGRLALFRALNDASPFHLGVGGDHRFGSFRWLPRVRWQQTGPSGQWLVDLPVSVSWRSPSPAWTISLERNGDRWATLDQDARVESALYLQEWRAELTYRISAARHWRPNVTMGLGLSMDTRVRYQDLNVGTVHVNLAETLFGTIRIHW